MSIASLIRQMAEAGASPEAIAIAVEAVEAAHAQDAERRAKAAEKKARQRATKRDNEGTVPGQGGDTSRDLPSSSEVSPQTPLPNSSNPLPPSPPKGGSSPAEFDEWYRHYPHKVGRGQAEKAFPAARRLASLETLVAATQQYAAKTDDRPWKNPATWLNGKCWLDAPAAEANRSTAPPNRRRNFVDAAMDRINGHGPESLFGNHGDAQRISSGQLEPRSDVEDIRGGIAGRYGGGGH